MRFAMSSAFNRVSFLLFRNTAIMSMLGLIEVTVDVNLNIEDDTVCEHASRLHCTVRKYYHLEVQLQMRIDLDSNELDIAGNPQVGAEIRKEERELSSSVKPVPTWRKFPRCKNAM